MSELVAWDLFPEHVAPRPEQLPLGLGLDDRMRPEDFLVSPANEIAYGLIERWPEGRDPVLVLYGPTGAGKTHLARIWQARTGARWLAAPLDAGLEQDHLVAGGPWVVDDAERLGDEAFLFHLVNVARAEGLGLVIVSQFPPSVWRPRLPDLRSRLLAAPAVAIEPPDEALLGAVLVKQLADRQLRVPPAVVHYLVTRMERSFAACRRIVELVDHLALSRGRPINTALARDVLKQLEGEAE